MKTEPKLDFMATMELAFATSNTSSKSVKYKRDIKSFIDALQSMIGKEKLSTFVDKKHFKNKSIYTIQHNFPILQRLQTSLSIKNILKNNPDITKCQLVAYNYDDTSYITPSYETTEIKRGKYKSVLTSGIYYIVYKKTPIKINVAFLYNDNAPIYISHLKKDEKLAHELVALFENDRKDNNHFNGEKICLSALGKIDYLDYKKFNWEDLIMNDEMKDGVDKNILFPLKNKKFFEKYKIPWKRGLLVTGPPGTGKTQLGKVLCSNLECTIIWVSSQSIESGSFSIGAIYELARELSPTIVFFEDIDLIGTDRDYGSSTEAVLAELLTQMDGISENHGVFTVATTNKPLKLDEALMNRPSRFDKTLEFPPPDEGAREIFFKQMLDNKDKLTPTGMVEIVTKTKGYTGAHIKELIINARKLSYMDKHKGEISYKYLEESFKELVQSFKAYNKDDIKESGHYG